MSYVAIFNILHLYYIMYNFLFLCNPSCPYTCENVCSVLSIGLLFVPSHLSLRLSFSLTFSLFLPSLYLYIRVKEYMHELGISKWALLTSLCLFYILILLQNLFLIVKPNFSMLLVSMVSRKQERVILNSH